jgi:hypothetical protein
VTLPSAVAPTAAPPLISRRHLLAADAVFDRHGEGVRIHEAPPPARTDVVEVAQRVHERALVWLRRHRYLDERAAEERSNEPAEQTPIDALARLALAGGTFVGRPFPVEERARGEDMDRKEPRFSAAYNGFDVHYAVRVEAGDDAHRERLVRYCARPPFALERIEVTKDGRVLYRMKTPRRGKTHREMTPVEFLARLAVLVPPPYFPLVRYHGVFAARSSWRKRVTPKPPDGVARRKKKPQACSDGAHDGAPLAAPAPVPQAGANDVTATRPAPVPGPQAGVNEPTMTTPPRAPAAPVAMTAAIAAASATPAAAPAASVAFAYEDPTMIAAPHWHRILDGELYAASSRIEWALLLRRTYGVDALRCPRCAGRMRVLATIVEPATVKKILTHLGLPTTPPPRAPARDPTGQESFDFDAA